MGAAGPLPSAYGASQATARRRLRTPVRQSATRLRRAVSRSAQLLLPAKRSVPALALAVSVLMFVGLSLAAGLLAPGVAGEAQGAGGGGGGAAGGAAEKRRNPQAPFLLAKAIGDGDELHVVARKAPPVVGARHHLVDDHVYCRHEEGVAAAKGRMENVRGEVLANGYAEGGSEVAKVLVGNYSVPEAVVRVMGSAERAALLFKMHYLAARRPAVGVRLLIVHVQNGLGNRLRAMAGGIALAKYTGRIPVVVWEKDAHLSARYQDLFVHSMMEKGSSGGGLGDASSGAAADDSGGEPPMDDDLAYSGRRRSAGVSATDDYVDSATKATMDAEMERLLYRDFVLLESFVPWAEVPSFSSNWIPVNQMQKETDGDSAQPLFFADEDEAGEDAGRDGLAAERNPARRVVAAAAFEDPQDPQDAQGAQDPPQPAAAEPIQVGVQAPAPAPAPAPPPPPPGGVRAGEEQTAGSRAQQQAVQAAAITPGHHIYLKTAYVPTTQPFRGVLFQSDIDPLLRRLVPVDAVQRVVSQTMPSNIHAAVGVHIRSRSLQNDNVEVDKDCEYTADGAEVTDFWRKRSQSPVFVAKMQRYLDRNPTIHFFVATDDYKAVDLLNVVFPGRIAYIPRRCDDRTPACVQYALADLMCLARTRKIIGSNWSSFSEAAGRLNGGPLYLSGVHFGRAPEAPKALGFFARLTQWSFAVVSSKGSSFTDPFYKCKSQPIARARRRRLHR